MRSIKTRPPQPHCSVVRCCCQQSAIGPPLDPEGTPPLSMSLQLLCSSKQMHRAMTPASAPGGMCARMSPPPPLPFPHHQEMQKPSSSASPKQVCFTCEWSPCGRVAAGAQVASRWWEQRQPHMAPHNTTHCALPKLLTPSLPEDMPFVSPAYPSKPIIKHSFTNILDQHIR